MKKKFKDTNLTESDEYYKHGIVKFSTFEAIVKEYKDQVVTLFTAHEISAGDQYSILAGCDKTFSTCQNKFNNAVNFRGEPHIPMANRLIR